MYSEQLSEGTRLTGAPANDDYVLNPSSWYNIKILVAISSIIGLTLGLTLGLVKLEGPPSSLHATALINNGTIKGTASFSQTVGTNVVSVSLSLVGIPASTGWKSATAPLEHGFHVHVNADLGNYCANAGAHLNVLSTVHGAPTNYTYRHTGDLGNHVTAADGSINAVFTDSVISLVSTSPAYIVGRSFVIHADADDYGLMPDEHPDS